MVTHYFCEPTTHLSGKIQLPGDKSISHRAVMLGAIAEGVTHVSGFLEGNDALATIQAFRSMGVNIQGPEKGELFINGVGMRGLKMPAQAIDCGNSGTTMRLLAGLLAGQNFTSVLIGDESLNKRPMQRVVTPLTQMGARVETAANDYPPLRIHASQNLHAIDYQLPMASAQVKSAILLAGLYATGRTTVIESAPTRDHTERMLQAFGYPLEVQGNKISLTGGKKLISTAMTIPADISSAAFFMVAASITPGSDILLTRVGINPRRSGVITILKQMGADIILENKQELSGEPVADIRVRHAKLHGITIPRELVPLAIDEFPVLFIAAANAQETTTLVGAEELRVKESDRIAVMAEGLKTLGIKVQTHSDGLVIEGAVSYEGGIIDSHGDHRIAMAFTVAALRANAPIEIQRCDNVATSFPNFVALARECGLIVFQKNILDKN